MLKSISKKYFTSTNLSSSIVIVNAKRTPVGSFMGKLSNFHAADLGSAAIQGALLSSNVAKEEIDEVIMGNVISAGLGQAPARQAAIRAGLPSSTVCTTINKVCSSGLKAVHFAAQSIQTGNSNVVVAGGMESMSLVPHYLYIRKAMTWGEPQMVDGIMFDGLTDSFSKKIMGSCSEKTVKDLNITREEQDEFTINGYEKAIAAGKAGYFAKEIIPLELKDKKGNLTVIDSDEEYTRFLKDKIPKLRPVFEKDGTITAANASKNADGGCAMVLMSEQRAKEKNLKPIARIINFADAEREPMDFSIAPAIAMEKILQRSNMKINDIDAIEINEAFACVALANIKLLGLDKDKVNVNGGAVALGHPIGMSGARIILSLINALQIRNGKYGMAAICNGGGGASSLIIERI